MENKKVLYITQEITPYLPESEISVIGRYLPQGIQERGNEIRTFMPRYGCVNERRNQLHEVIRLSGMNLIIDETDHPLIIKVASIQCARMQVYFIDNEDYFQRRSMMSDEEGNFFEDNDERAIFFVRGVLETVKKLCWSPDIVHCHGWFTSLAPLLLKKAYRDDPVFSNTKVVYSIYNDSFPGAFDKNFPRKVKVDGIAEKDLSLLKEPSWVNLNKAAMKYSDGIILGNNEIEENFAGYAEGLSKPYIRHPHEENYLDRYSEFYNKILSKNSK